MIVSYSITLIQMQNSQMLYSRLYRRATFFSLVFFILQSCAATPNVPEFVRSDIEEVIRFYLQDYPEGEPEIREFVEEYDLEDPDGQYMMGHGLHLAGNKERAKYWYELSADQGYFASELQLLEYDIEGVGERRQEFSSSLGLLIKYFKKAPKSLVENRIYSLWVAQESSMFSLDLIANEWFEYLISGDQSWADSYEFSDPIKRFKNRLGDYYAWKARKLDGDEEEIVASYRYLEVARDYYEQTQNETKLSKLKPHDILLARTNPKVFDVCEEVFNRRDKDALLLLQAQKKIFENPSQIGEITKTYYQERDRNYDKGGSKPVSLKFETISSFDLLEIYFGYLYQTDIADNRSFVIDERLKKNSIMVYASNIHFPLLINLMLSQMNIFPECELDVIRFTMVSENSEENFILMPYLIDSWSGGISISNGELNGLGRLGYSEVFTYEGEVMNSLPNGKGAYQNKGSVIEASMIENGMISGYGYEYAGDELYYEGEFNQGKKVGYGQFGKLRYIYIGQHVNYIMNGEGTITYVNRNLDPNDYVQFSYSLEAPVDKVSFYRGSFKDGKEHGQGKCGIYRSDQSVDEFNCNFYEGTLWRINGVSLLPPDSDLRHLRKTILEDY